MPVACLAIHADKRYCAPARRRLNTSSCELPPLEPPWTPYDGFIPPYLGKPFAEIAGRGRERPLFGLGW
jgi:hypothetical protein